MTKLEQSLFTVQTIVNTDLPEVVNDNLPPHYYEIYKEFKTDYNKWIRVVVERSKETNESRTIKVGISGLSFLQTFEACKSHYRALLGMEKKQLNRLHNVEQEVGEFESLVFIKQDIEQRISELTHKYQRLCELLDTFLTELIYASDVAQIDIIGLDQIVVDEQKLLAIIKRHKKSNNIKSSWTTMSMIREKLEGVQLDWQHVPGEKGYTKRIASKLLDAPKPKEIKVHSTKIDLIFSNRPKRINKSFNMLTGLSDHNLTLIARKLTKRRFTAFVQEGESLIIPRNKQDGFKSAVQNIDWEAVLVGNSLENNSQRLMQKLQSTINDFTCRQRRRKKNNIIPWMNTTVLNLMKRRDMALKIALKSKLSSDRYTFTMLRNKVVKELRTSKANYFLNIIEKAGGNTKNIWNQLRKLMGQNVNNTNSIAINANGTLLSNPAEVAVALNHHFIDSVADIIKCFPPTHIMPCQSRHTEPAFNLETITDSDVQRVIGSLRSSKAIDVIGMNTVMLKELSASLVYPITQTVNLSIAQETFPDVWKLAAVSPIFKGGDQQSVSNYRPISILPAVSKVAEKLVAEQIINHLNTSSYFLHPNQFGFCTNHSTETANCYFIEKIKLMLDKGGVVGAVFLDLKKAFDTINHGILLGKLSTFNFSSGTINWIQSYLTNRSQFVRIKNHQSDTNSLAAGVPRGSILGPLLFSLYVNDLPTVCPNSNTIMYADDTVIFMHGSSAARVDDQLTNSMQHITDWLKQNCLQLNVSKTVCMFFSKTKIHCPEPDVIVDGERLRVVSDFKYLRVVIDNNLTFKEHIKKVSKCIKFNLANFRHVRSCMSTTAALMYMHSMILSHITYCLTTWSQASSTALKPLFSLYKKTIKKLDKKSNDYHHCHILLKYKLLHLENLIKYAHLCLMYKIIHGLAPPVLNQFIKVASTSTRSAARGDCVVQFRKSAFSQSAFSIRAAHEWNSIPTDIRNLSNYASFKSFLKKWLISGQGCQH
ncbi:MAG: hypothetical protein ATN35_07545 [Epulopiscium sp. Nele67-Bin004]|nr:MAG: hypothetical protein ATN35_07545 [Epulopiscium sp. Nele67-Bin004]